MIYNFGSINIDHIYRVSAFPKAGETIAAKSYECFLGGKGVNQSVAIAKAGGDLCHIGAVGADGKWALDQMAALGVFGDGVEIVGAETGHAIIYVDDQAENQIVISGGANQALTEQIVSDALSTAGPDDWVIFQNEMNMSTYIAETARARRCKLAYSAAPFSKVHAIPLLKHLDLLVVNETEAADLQAATNQSLLQMGLPMILVTKGKKGAELRLGQETVKQSSFPVQAVDTTGAGDTFLGSFMAVFDKTNDAEAALQYAAAASAIQVTRVGTASAIPNKTEVDGFLKDQTT